MPKLHFIVLSFVLAMGGTFASPSDSPYGVCSHVTRWERDPSSVSNILSALHLSGIGYVRTDFDSCAVTRPGGKYDFTDYDRIFGELESHGVKVLPIVGGYRPGGNVPEDLDAYADYVRTIVTHYGNRFPVIEIWNEANLDSFFKGGTPETYAKVLRRAYGTIKSVDPAIRVAFTGTAGVPLDWIRRAFIAGATNCFDVMNVHPYTHPECPEGALDVRTESLRALLCEYGIGDRPIWFTEIGWPTHQQTVAYSHILNAGLKVARPDLKRWRVVFASIETDGKMMTRDREFAECLREVLPSCSEVEVCTQSETIRRLADGDVDAVAYPFSHYFPGDTIDAVNDFITRGGTLIEFGGLPCYYGRRGQEKIKGQQDGGALGRFPFGYRAWWSDDNGTWPKSAQVFATDIGLAAGVRQEPTGFTTGNFLAPDRIGEKSEWIPLVAGRATNGTELVSAAVVRYHGERKGAAVLCALSKYHGVFGTNDEENQARYTARALGIAFAEGVEAYFAYALRTPEKDPYYSEHHFGLMHLGYEPKPAFTAYAHFTRERPAGSANLPDAWHDEKRRFYFPQWRRPDGTCAGMVWSPVAKKAVELQFADGTPDFRNLYGRRIAVRDCGNGRYLVPVSGSPVYFSGARMVSGDFGALPLAGAVPETKPAVPDRMRLFPLSDVRVTGEDDTGVPIRPGDPERGVPFWNDYATVFRYAPAFSFVRIDGATKYRFTVGNAAASRTFEADRPWAPLTPVWRELPNGTGYSATCEGLDASGRVIGLSGVRRFTKTAAFADVKLPPAARPYREAARMIYGYMTSLPAMRTLLETGKPDQTYQHNAYVSKTHAAHIEAMLRWARLDPSEAEKALAFAKASADYLLGELEPAGAPLAWWPPTYGRRPLDCDAPKAGGTRRENMVGNEPAAAVRYRKEVMLVYPATVGTALLRYRRAIGEGGRKYLDAACGIAETYLRIRRADGSWPLKMILATGEPTGRGTLVPTAPMTLFAELADATGDAKWRRAADNCLVWLERGPVRTMNWDGQFEDIEPNRPYMGLTKHNALDTMFWILKRYPGDEGKLSVARDLIRFSEDQFVFWEPPSGRAEKIPAPGAGARSEPPATGEYGGWDYPSVFEQYSCYCAIDASAAKLIRAYVALWKATGNPTDLAKARALADAITRVQLPSGRVPTFWSHNWAAAETYDWLNCMAASAAALVECAEASE